MAGRLKVYNLSTGAWEYVNTTQALRFIPVASGAWDLNASVGNTAEQVLELAASIPANVPGIVAVSLYGLVRDQATASGAAGGANTTLTVRHYPSGDVAMTAYSGGVGQRGGTWSCHYVEVGGTNNRCIKWNTSTSTNTSTAWLQANGYWVVAP